MRIFHKIYIIRQGYKNYMPEEKKATTSEKITLALSLTASLISLGTTLWTLYKEWKKNFS
jgi:hypothetical protein